ncbi:MAG: 50S ribosomal protein L11 methyltransferase, partial [Blastocatellia bacterium]
MKAGNTDNDDGWFMLSLSLARESEEAANALLFELGSTGVVTLSESETEIRIGGYFAASADIDEISRQVTSGLANSGLGAGPAKLEVSYVPDQDWLQKWKEGYEPVTVGERFLIVPSWKLESVLKEHDAAVAVEAGNIVAAQSSDGGVAGTDRPRIIILIDPGMAFGTGTHETTRLCLGLVERYWAGGKFLDVGTGTGILAIAAAKLVPESGVTGIDIDSVAVEVARENAAINGVPEIDIRQAQPRDLGESSFNIVVANLTTDLIALVIDDLTALVTQGGYLLLSGILREQGAEIARALEASALKIVERSDEGE